MLKKKKINKKRIVSVFLVLALVLCGCAQAFADVDYNEWNSNGIYPSDVMGTRMLIYVKYLMDRGIVTGDSDGLFHPESSINRAEFATMMARATNNVSELETLKNQEIFSDLAGYGWAKPYINAVVRAEIFKGRSADKFAPAEAVTYAEVITVLIRMSKGAASSAEGMAPKWPDNYIAYAGVYNYLGDVVVEDWNAPATKGDVARLMYRTITRISRYDSGAVTDGHIIDNDIEVEAPLN